ncbi:3-hydroxyacyl-CoA dehydrogenase family protein [Microbacterium oxydans]|uniref:3-hydroxyacyl-CoA dehydrogenase family protein n=1 Tax=Microbacterium oxydans TaxID=82380 RepID=UPI0024ADA792|nr:3-hydroxyacyl-CoA dehydrogenase family protein [Microbacterium oxydans]
MTESTFIAPEQVGVLGGGRMGAGIAHAFLLAGSRVGIVERDADAAEAATARVLESIDASVARGTALDSPEAYRARLTTGTDAALFAQCTLVVEAVPEDLALKVDALRRVEAQIAPDAAIASNTSSISIDELAAVLDRPERLLGMHFFNPVPASTLVEIVHGASTAPALVDAARGWVAAIGKTPIVVADAPGFASSRLGVAIGLEAIRMLEEGVASAEDIDAAMTLGYKHPVGPLRLTDIVGLDVRLGIAEYLSAQLGERFEPPALLRRLVAEGHLGRKSGRGFYVWDASGREQK